MEIDFLWISDQQRKSCADMQTRIKQIEITLMTVFLPYPLPMCYSNSYAIKVISTRSFVDKTTTLLL